MAKQKIEKVDNLEVVNAGAMKRVGALVIDALLMAVLMLILSFVMRPILNATSNLTKRYDEQQREIKRSYLVTLSAELTVDESNIDTVEIVQDSVPFYKHAEATYNFYVNYLGKQIDDEGVPIDEVWYLKTILLIDDQEASLFKRINEEAPKPKINYLSSGIASSEPTSDSMSESTSEATSVAEPLFDPFLPAGITYKASEPNVEELNKFYLKIYSGAIKVLQQNKEYAAVNNLIMMENVLLIVISSSVFFLALPLFLKNGQTLGKMAFKLGLSTTYGYKVRPLQILLRYFVFLIVNLLSNIFIPIIFPFVSLTIMVFNRRGKSLHDFAAMTRVVDLRNSHIYTSPEEYANNLKVVMGPRDGDFNEEVFSERYKEDSGA